MHRRLCIILAVAAMVVAACGGGTTREFPEASAEQIEWLNLGLNEGVTVINLHRARSETHTNAYFIAGKMGENVAVWLITGDPDDPGQALSVNRYALENSTWLDGSRTGAETSMSDPPARELERFVSQQ